MKILLTGGTGYLGSHLAERFLQSGYQVACTVRDRNKLKRLEKLQPWLTLIETGRLEEQMGQYAPDVVVHAACTYARGEHNSYDIMEGNLLFPYRVLEAAKHLGVKKWINTGTCLPAMTDIYAMSKDQFRQWGRFCAEQGSLQFLNLRLEHFYGPDASEDHFLTWVLRKLKSNVPLDLTVGTQKRDFVYLEDVLRVYSKVLEYPFQADYVEIPVGTGEAPMIREVVEFLKEHTGSASELRFGAVPLRKNEPNSCCNTSILQQLGLLPMTEWKIGMRILL